MGNIYTNESRASALKRCSEFDKSLRQLFTQKNVIGKTSTKTIIYLPVQLGGLGEKSIEKHVNGGWRDRIKDAEFVLNKYEIELEPKNEEDTIR